MGAALRSGNVVYVRKKAFGIAVVVLYCQFHQNIPAFAPDMDGRLIQNGFIRIEIAHKVAEPAFKAVYLFLWFPAPAVRQGELYAPVQIAKLPKVLGDGLIIKFHRFKDPVIGHESDGGALLAGAARFLQGVQRMTGGNVSRFRIGDAGKFLFVSPVLGAYLHRDPATQSIDHGGAHAVQAAGIAIGIMAEFPPCVELGKYHFHPGNTQLFVNAYRDTPAVVADGGGAILVEGDGNLVGIAVGGFVYSVVYDLPQQVMEPLGARGAYIHTGAHAHGVQPLHDGYIGNGIFHSNSSRGFLPGP